MFYTSYLWKKRVLTFFYRFSQNIVFHKQTSFFFNLISVSRKLENSVAGWSFFEVATSNSYRTRTNASFKNTAGRTYRNWSKRKPEHIEGKNAQEWMWKMSRRRNLIVRIPFRASNHTFIFSVRAYKSWRERMYGEEDTNNTYFTVRPCTNEECSHKSKR